MLEGLPKLSRKQLMTRGRGPNVSAVQKVQKQIDALTLRQTALACVLEGKKATLQN